MRPPLPRAVVEPILVASTSPAALSSLASVVVPVAPFPFAASEVLVPPPVALEDIAGVAAAFEVPAALEFPVVVVPPALNVSVPLALNVHVPADVDIPVSSEIPVVVVVVVPAAGEIPAVVPAALEVVAVSVFPVVAEPFAVGQSLAAWSVPVAGKVPALSPSLVV